VYGRHANLDAVNKELLRSIESSIDESRSERLGTLHKNFEMVVNKNWGVQGMGAWVNKLDPASHAELFELFSTVMMKADYGLAYQNTWMGNSASLTPGIGKLFALGHIDVDDLRNVVSKAIDRFRAGGEELLERYDAGRIALCLVYLVRGLPKGLEFARSELVVLVEEYQMQCSELAYSPESSDREMFLKLAYLIDGLSHDAVFEQWSQYAEDLGLVDLFA
jgi:hypothetical protein